MPELIAEQANAEIDQSKPEGSQKEAEQVSLTEQEKELSIKIKQELMSATDAEGLLRLTKENSKVPLERFRAILKEAIETSIKYDKYDGVRVPKSLSAIIEAFSLDRQDTFEFVEGATVRGVSEAVSYQRFDSFELKRIQKNLDSLDNLDPGLTDKVRETVKPTIRKVLMSKIGFDNYYGLRLGTNIEDFEAWGIQREDIQKKAEEVFAKGLVETLKDDYRLRDMDKYIASLEKIGGVSEAFVANMCERAVGEALADGNFRVAYRIAKSRQVSNEIFATKKAAESIAGFLKGGFAHGESEEEILAFLPPTIFKEDSVREAVQDKIVKNFEMVESNRRSASYSYRRAVVEEADLLKIKQRYSLPDELYYEAVAKGQLANPGNLEGSLSDLLPEEYLEGSQYLELATRYFAEAIDRGEGSSFLHCNNVPEMSVVSTEVREAARRYFLREMSGEEFFSYGKDELVDKLRLPDEFFATKEFSEKAILLAKREETTTAQLLLLRNFGLPNEFFNQPEQQEKIKDSMAELIEFSSRHLNESEKWEHRDDLVKLKKMVADIEGLPFDLKSLFKESISDDGIKSASQKLAARLVEANDLDFAVQTFQAFECSNDFFQTEAAWADKYRAIFFNKINAGNFDEAEAFAEKFGLDTEFIKERGREVISHKVKVIGRASIENEGVLDDIRAISERYEIDQSAIDEIIMKEVSYHTIYDLEGLQKYKEHTNRLITVFGMEREKFEGDNFREALSRIINRAFDEHGEISASAEDLEELKAEIQQYNLSAAEILNEFENIYGHQDDRRRITRAIEPILGQLYEWGLIDKDAFVQLQVSNAEELSKNSRSRYYFGTDLIDSKVRATSKFFPDDPNATQATYEAFCRLVVINQPEEGEKIPSYTQNFLAEDYGINCLSDETLRSFAKEGMQIAIESNDFLKTKEYESSYGPELMTEAELLESYRIAAIRQLDQGKVPHFEKMDLGYDFMVSSEFLSKYDETVRGIIGGARPSVGDIMQFFHSYNYYLKHQMQEPGLMAKISGKRAEVPYLNTENFKEEALLNIKAVLDRNSIEEWQQICDRFGITKEEIFFDHKEEAVESVLIKIEGLTPRTSPESVEEFKNFIPAEIFAAKEVQDLVTRILTTQLQNGHKYKETINEQNELSELVGLSSERMKEAAGEAVRKLLENDQIGQAIEIFEHFKPAVDLSDSGDIYPITGRDDEKATWCSKNSFVYLKGDWNRAILGKVIRTRIETGVDGGIHNATQWLSSFEVPDKAYSPKEIKQAAKNDEVDLSAFEERLLHSEVSEKELIRSIVDAPKELRDRLLLPSKQDKVNQIFFHPENRLYFQALLTMFKEDELDVERLREKAFSMAGEYYDSHLDVMQRKDSSHKITYDEFVKKIEGVSFRRQYGTDEQPITAQIKALSDIGAARKEYIDDATTWILRHATSPQARLTKVWPDRVLAISANIEDNARSIEDWQQDNAFQLTVKKLESQGRLPEGLTRAELLGEFKPWGNEMLRCYGVNAVIKEIGHIKRVLNTEALLPPAVIGVPIEIDGKEKKFRTEILAKTDPRGTTIGHDTGCCMTIDGVSRACIEAGYAKKECGFYALYTPEGQLAAQSFFYVNPEHPDTLVIDNIEANAGRDTDRIIAIYRESYRQYLQERLAEDPDWKITRIHLGAGYGEVVQKAVLKLPKAKIVTPIVPYSDASEIQVLLLELTEDEIQEAKAKAKPKEVEIQMPEDHEKKFRPMHREELAIQEIGTSQLPIIEGLEADIYGDVAQYDPDFLKEEARGSRFGEFSFLVSRSKDASKDYIGYCLAYTQKSELNPNSNEEVLYVSDLATIQETRSALTGVRMIDEIITRAEQKGISQIEFHARESTTYKALTRKWARDYLHERGYQVIEGGERDRLEGEKKSDGLYLVGLRKIS